MKTSHCNKFLSPTVSEAHFLTWGKGSWSERSLLMGLFSFFNYSGKVALYGAERERRD